MGLFDKMREPIFLRQGDSAQKHLEELRGLKPLLNQEGQNIIQQDIKYLEYGIIGENTIIYELKHSHMPMYILHDIYIERGDMSSQIDFLVITKKIIFVIECKNLYGNIEINSSGDFIRTLYYGNKYRKEGIYSPITQNQRHWELLKKIAIDRRGNIFTKYLTDKYFEDFNKSVVVLANHKTVLNARFAKKNVKDNVIRADQLAKYINDICTNSNVSSNSEATMLAKAQYYLNLHKDVQKDYTKKYEQYMISTATDEVFTIKDQLITQFCNSIEETEIYKNLRQYRLEQSRKENVKPYLIYNNNQLEHLISKKPKTKEDLKMMPGFGEVKVNKYGDAILEIISKY